MFPQRRQSVQPKPKEKEKKCKITIKKRKDGTLVKEISGECTSQELKALSNQKDIEEE